MLTLFVGLGTVAQTKDAASGSTVHGWLLPVDGAKVPTCRT